MVKTMNIIELQEKLKNLNIDMTANEICNIWGMDKGAYFTACFRTELAKAEFKRVIKEKMGVA